LGDAVDRFAAPPFECRRERNSAENTTLEAV